MPNVVSSPARRRQNWAYERLNYRFNNPALLEEALTHASAATPIRRGRKTGKRSNERLEFLGDRVLGLAVAHLLIEFFPDEAEGDLTHRHDALVRRESLAQIAELLVLAEHLVLGKTKSAGNGGVEMNPAILADLCEAVLGAIYLDGGYEAAKRVIETNWTPLIEDMPVPPRDPKTSLQEWAQARGLNLPEYTLECKTGPAHAPKFSVAVSVEPHGVSHGDGNSKRAAEQEAAEKMLAQLVQKKTV